MGGGKSGMAKGKGGGGARQASQTEQEQFVDRMVTALNTYVPGETPMSNSDLQASVEAFADSHPGVNEDALLDTIRLRAQADRNASNGTQASAQISAPSDFKASIINGRTVNEYAQSKGLEKVSNSDIKNLPIGTKVVVSSPVMNTRMSSRRDPDAVHFSRGTFIGFQPTGAKRPIVQLDGGKKVAVETDYPFETIYRKG